MQARGRLEACYSVLADSPLVYPAWWRRAVKHRVSRVRVHDARLAAVMVVHGISHILTFNTADFARFDGITAVHPAAIVAAG